MTSFPASAERDSLLTARVALGLASAGALPFLAGLAGLVFWDGALTGHIQIYAAVIASFLCGMHWGVALLAPRAPSVPLLLGSNVAALAAWAAAMAPASIGFLAFAALFAAVAAIDQLLHRTGIWPDWFWRLRLTISAIVVVTCLLIGIVA